MTQKHPLLTVLLSVAWMLITLGVIVGSYSVGIALLIFAPPKWAADICLLQISSAIVISILAVMAAIDYSHRADGVSTIKNAPPSTNANNALLRKNSRTGLASYDSSPRLHRGMFSPKRPSKIN